MKISLRGMIALPFAFLSVLDLQQVSADASAKEEFVSDDSASSSDSTIVPISDATATGMDSSYDERIIGGIEAKFDSFPYYVHVRNVPKIGGNGYMCGGALIAPDFVLTAGHCEKYPIGEWIVEIYANAMFKKGGYQKRKCKRWLNHEKYLWLKDSSDSLMDSDMDFAICELNRPVYLTQSSIVLEINNDDSLPRIGQKVTQIGLGRTESEGELSDWLQYAALPAISNEKCEKSYDMVTENVLCIKPENNSKAGQCSGDSGGPNVIVEGDKHILVGVTSFSSCNADARKPRALARVNKALPWVVHRACNTLKSVGKFCDASTDDFAISKTLNGTRISTFQGDQTNFLFPYFVRIEVDYGDIDYTDRCGGTLIGPDMVLTAASCGNPDKEYTVYANNMYVHGGSEERKCDKWINHPSYKRVYLNNPSSEERNNAIYDEVLRSHFLKTDYDFALCKLKEPVYLHQSGLTLELNNNRSSPYFEEEVTQVSLKDESDPDLLAKAHTFDTFQALDENGCATLYGSAFENAKENLLCVDPKTSFRNRFLGEPNVLIDGDRHILVGVSGSLTASQSNKRFLERTSTIMPWIHKTACNTLNSQASFCRGDEWDDGAATISTFLEDNIRKQVYADPTPIPTIKPTKKSKPKNNMNKKMKVKKPTKKKMKMKKKPTKKKMKVKKKKPTEEEIKQ